MKHFVYCASILGSLLIDTVCTREDAQARRGSLLAA